MAAASDMSWTWIIFGLLRCGKKRFEVELSPGCDLAEIEASVAGQSRLHSNGEQKQKRLGAVGRGGLDGIVFAEPLFDLLFLCG